MDMKRTPIRPDMEAIPSAFHHLLTGAAVYDSSCSPQARVMYIETDGGYYLKASPAGTLSAEAEMTRYFHQKGLAAEVLHFVSGEQDWLLTARVPGEDATDQQYLADPKRLCDTIALQLRRLHELDTAGCPIPDHTARYLKTVEKNYSTGHYDAALFPDNWGYASAEEAIRVVERHAHLLKNDTLLHGDYCLPNIMLDNWRFSGFIDLGNGGVGDRHVDIFWGAWTLSFNLKTDRYRDRFLDAYGRDAVEEEILRVIAACEVFG